ncbi:LacI family DNA-binding transcriptional regulator [Nocardiopsis changdeensis]|uniref:LacI family DNA-binding transcriptional regulator n=1 Tax=Nocardiopsis changdeensis TaxID=2831969 RepID=UPI003F46B13C
MAERTARTRVTAADIAREVGVSRATVGFVLNDTPGQTISAATRERVLRTARRLGYRPHRAAQALASGQSRIILFVLPDWPLDYSMRRYLEEASLLLDEAGYGMVTYTPHPGGTSRPLWESLDPDVVVGFTAFGPEDSASLRASGVTRVIPAPDESEGLHGAPALTAGPELQVRHLVEQGHTDLAFAASADTRLEELVRERGENAHRACLDAGARWHGADFIDGGDPGALVRRWHEEGVTGVVAYNDDVAAAVVGAALRAGLDVPDDLAVVGHDDSPLASVFVPALSSVRLDTGALGRALAGRALDEAQGRPRERGHIEVRAELVRREST